MLRFQDNRGQNHGPKAKARGSVNSAKAAGYSANVPNGAAAVGASGDQPAAVEVVAAPVLPVPDVQLDAEPVPADPDVAWMFVQRLVTHLLTQNGLYKLHVVNLLLYGKYKSFYLAISVELIL